MTPIRPSAQAFKDKVKDTPVIMLEAGIYRGYNSKTLYDNFNCKILYLMDKWYKDYDQYHVECILEYAKTAMEFFDGKDNVMIVKADSLLFPLFPANYFDYVYLDNDHSYNHCVKEFPKYWATVKKGGMLSGDNLEANGVGKALGEFCTEHNLTYEQKPWKVGADNKPIASDWWIWK